MATLFIHDPRPVGKTFHSMYLAAYFGCNSIIDGWVDGDDIQKNALHIALYPPSDSPEWVDVLSFETACLIAGINPLRLRR